MGMKPQLVAVASCTGPTGRSCGSTHSPQRHCLKLSMARIVFVSGGSGFVGSAVIAELLRRGCRVHALVHRKPIGASDARVASFPGEADDPVALDAALERASAAIHLVGIIAERPSANVTFHRMHVDCTRAVVDACVRNNVRRYVHMSALGARPDAPSVYHQTKAAAEEIVRAAPLAWTILRPSLIHGLCGEFTQVMAAWARGRKPPWFFMPYFGAGFLGLGRKFLVQPVSVNDVARAFVDAVELPEAEGRSFDVGGADRLAWPEMYQVFSRNLLGHEKATLAIPAWKALLLTRLLPAALVPFNRAQVLMSQEDSIADMTEFQRVFSFTPEGFAAAIARYAPTLR